MKLPKEMDLPFFTYGLFKPGQLGHFRIKDFVFGIEKCEVIGELWERDGLPLLNMPDSNIVEGVKGYLIRFFKDLTQEAYKKIIELEPEKQYKWEEIEINDQKVNTLIGVKPRNGGLQLENTKNWDGEKDPLFVEALDVVEEIRKENQDGDIFRDWKSFFRLEMAYLLLWSSIERYISLRYGVGKNIKIWKKRKKLSEEKAFQKGLKEIVGGNLADSDSQRRETIYRSDDPCESYKLDSEKPYNSIEYYYTIRCNLSHRGKRVQRDFDTVKASLDELYKIFRKHVLSQAFKRDENVQMTRSIP